MDNRHTFMVAPIGKRGEELAPRIPAIFVRDWAGGRNVETIHWPIVERPGQFMAVGVWFGTEEIGPLATIPMTREVEVNPKDSITIKAGDLPFLMSLSFT